MESSIKKSLKLLMLTLVTFGLQSIIVCAQGTRKADFPGGERMGAVGFSISDKVYIGTGGIIVGDYITCYKDFWEYDPATNSWTQKLDFGGAARYGAVGFSIGDKGYIGTGEDDSAEYNDFWEYDPGSNTWTKRADFGGTQRMFAVGFSIENKGYIGTGGQNDFWEYDPATNSWAQKSDFGGAARLGAVGFSIGDKGYIGTGTTEFNGYSDFWQYDPVVNSWKQKSDFGGAARYGAVGFSIGDKGYIGVGATKDTTSNDFWQYDPVMNLWTQKADFEGAGRSFAVGASLGGRGYIGTGGVELSQSYIAFKDFWEYDPELALPGKVRLVYPYYSEAVNVDLGEKKLLLLWDQGHPTVTDFQVDISLDSSFSQIAFKDTAIFVSPYLWNVLQDKVRYWWRVRAKNASGWGPFSESRPFSASFGNFKIDVLVMYTPAAKAWADSNAGSIDLAIAQKLAIGQDVIYNSGVNLPINLVYSNMVDYTETGNSNVEITRLELRGDGYMDEVHELRSAHQADFVALFVRYSGGIAEILDNPNGDPGSAFSVSNIKSAFTFIHELGHNMGCMHSRNQVDEPAPSPPDGGLFVYSTGWRWKGADGKGYASIMTYPEGDLWVPVFSNPDIFWAGVPTGSYEEGNPFAPADNARSIRDIAGVIAKYSLKLTFYSPLVEQINSEIPDNYSLTQNYPNPFNPSTTIEFGLPTKSRVRVQVIDLLGRRVALLCDGEQTAGYQKVQWNTDVSSGIYFYRIDAASTTDPTNRFVQVKKMLLLK